MVAVDFSAPTFAIGKVSAEGHAGKFRINATIMSVKETPSNRQRAQCQSAMKVYGTKQTEANALILCRHPNQVGRVRYVLLLGSAEMSRLFMCDSASSESGHMYRLKERCGCGCPQER